MSYKIKPAGKKLRFLSLILVFFSIVFLYKASGLHSITSNQLLFNSEISISNKSDSTILENETSQTKLESESNQSTIPATITANKTVEEKNATSIGGGSSISGTYEKIKKRTKFSLSGNSSIYFENSTQYKLTILNDGHFKLENFTFSGNFSNITLENQSINRKLLPGEQETFFLKFKTLEKSCFLSEGELFVESNNYTLSLPLKFYANGKIIQGAVYYNRTFYHSNSYELVPVKNARIILSKNCSNQKTEQTNELGTFKIYTPKEEVKVCAIGPGFSVKNPCLNSENFLQFFLRKGKAKIALHTHEKFLIGKTSNITLISEGEELKEVTLNLKLLKEIENRTYLIAEKTETLNLSEFQYIKTNLTIPNNIPSKDLELPKLKLQLLTATSDAISEKESYTTIGFLEVNKTFNISKKNLGTLEVKNPTNREIKNIILTSEIENENSEQLNLGFSPNNFNLSANTSKKVNLSVTTEPQGEYKGKIKVSGTLTPLASWDDYASDLVELTVSFKFPRHDVAIFLNSGIVEKVGLSSIKAKLKNLGDFDEEVFISLLYNGTSVYNLTTNIEKSETKLLNLSWNASTFEPGIYNLSLFANISEDSFPNDNVQETFIFLSENPTPKNLVILVLDGVGYEYLNEDNTPNLFNLGFRGFNSKNTRVKIPSTTQSHSILFTSRYEPFFDWSAYTYMVSLPNSTLLDSARNNNYTLLGVMGQGDAPEFVEKFDAILYDENNDWEKFDSNLSLKLNASNLSNTFEECNNLSNYRELNNSIFINYGEWTSFSTRKILEEIPEDMNFLLIVNFLGTDHAGHAGPSHYKETLKKVDIQVFEILKTLLETKKIENTLLTITADHGMCFKDTSYGTIGYHASCTKNRAYNIPFLVLGPKVKNKESESLIYQEDIVPTLAEFLKLEPLENTTGSLIKEFFEETKDVGIVNISIDNFLVGETITISVFLKNYSPFEVESELCLDISNYKSQTINCREFNLEKNSEKIETFNYFLEKSGSYKIISYLNSDDNENNNEFSLEKSTGIFHDLQIFKVPLVKEENKLKAKVVLKNLGHFNEKNISISCEKTNLNTGEKTNHTYKNKNLKSGSKKTFGPWACGDSSAENSLYNITFKILNYTNFTLDANPSNNIKTIITYFNE